MEAESGHPAEEIKRLRRCINDLVGIVALPAVWSGSDPSALVLVLLDALFGMLHLDFVYARLKGRVGEAPNETARVAPSRTASATAQEIGEMLGRCLGHDPQKWAPRVGNFMGDGGISLVPLRLGLQGEIGVLVAASRRADFPSHTESLVLGVAANQAAIGLQEARLLSEQKRLATELDRRVAQRTRELAAANEELKREIAERRLAEEALRRSEAHLAEAQKLSLTGSFGWRVAADEHLWSEETFRIFEYDASTRVTLQLILDRVHPQDIALARRAVTLAAEGKDLDYECRLLVPSGAVKYLHVVAHGTRNRNGQLEYIGAVQDVTERRHSEEALGKVRSELAHVARIMSLGALTASIAHEVNQPLSGIVTNASTCLRMLATDPPNVAGARETARRTIRDGNRASDVITRLRALFTKKETAADAVDLNAAAQEVIALSMSELQRGRAIVLVELADDLPLVTGDRVQLQQVILNLLLNASDAMSGVEDRPRQLAVRTEHQADDRVRLSVQDTGVGFAPAIANRLFEAFYTTKREGMGIGLSVSRSIIESHRGRLWAAANDGPGATFSFSLPRRSESATEWRMHDGTSTPAATGAEKVRESL